MNSYQLTQLQRAMLTAFADAGVPMSRYQLFRNSNIAQGNAAIADLVAMGLLEDAGTCDEWWGRRYRVTATGARALGRAVRAAIPHSAGVARSSAGRRIQKTA